ncbi:MAG: hypothetical protein JWP48_551 [Actinoallomurus sp.]|jgi:hypothetical protein|nr:hypothetical protein [Actinoallomurus sp.]
MAHDPAWRLDALGLTHDPLGHPLEYPGRPPAESGLLTGDHFVPLQEEYGVPPGRRRLGAPGGEPLDDALRRIRRPVIAERHPVLAVGSNGSPAQLHRKLAGRTGVLVPMTYVAVGGLVPGVSAHVSRPGYVPAAPVLLPGATGRLVLLWLDDAQLAVVDATEPNYHRIALPAEVTVSLDGAGPLTGCRVYAGRHGCLTDRSGRPFRLTGQAALLSGLLADLPELGRLIGARGPEVFVETLRGDEGLREQVRALWRREGRVAEQRGLGRAPG